MQEKTKILEINDLYLHFNTQKGDVQAVDGVNFEMFTDEAVVILGESGCGKSSLTKAILRLLPRNVARYDGSIKLKGQDIMQLSDEAYRTQIRWKKISMVPQSAMTSLNPVLRVGDQVAEPLIIGEGMKKNLAMEKAAEYFKYVGVPTDFLYRYAFELSGGMRQRAALAMALITEPDLVLLDEPTSALDVLTQCNIMNLLKRIKMENQASFILVTHDIATSSELANRVAIMYAGEIVEVSDSELFFKKPLHPYAQKLMASVPRLRGTDELEFISGKPPSLIGLPQGCRFAPRCPYKMDVCDQEPPVVKKGNSIVKCWLHK
ncbi:MAG: ABC transporter ATP-binding protein [Eubacteriales bacterium]